MGVRPSLRVTVVLPTKIPIRKSHHKAPLKQVEIKYGLNPETQIPLCLTPYNFLPDNDPHGFAKIKYPNLVSPNVTIQGFVPPLPGMTDTEYRHMMSKFPQFTWAERLAAIDSTEIVFHDGPRTNRSYKMWLATEKKTAIEGPKSERRYLIKTYSELEGGLAIRAGLPPYLGTVCGLRRGFLKTGIHSNPLDKTEKVVTRRFAIADLITPSPEYVASFGRRLGPSLTQSSLTLFFFRCRLLQELDDNPGNTLVVTRDKSRLGIEGIVPIDTDYTFPDLRNSGIRIRAENIYNTKFTEKSPPIGSVQFCQEATAKAGGELKYLHQQLEECRSTLLNIAFHSSGLTINEFARLSVDRVFLQTVVENAIPFDQLLLASTLYTQPQITGGLPHHEWRAKVAKSLREDKPFTVLEMVTGSSIC